MTEPTRVLGLDPSTRNIAFAVLEGPASLIDWGMKTTGKADSVRALEIIRALIERFQPEIVAIEDCRARESRRRSRIQELLNDVVSAVPSTVKLRRFPVGSLTPYGKTKQDRALALAGRFPELQSRLPRSRKTWDSEDVRINIFDALSFALACFPDFIRC